MWTERRPMRCRSTRPWLSRVRPVFGWPVLLAWGIALLLGVLILLFCGYELHWKVARLQRDQARLQEVAAQLGAVGAELAASQERIAAARLLAGR